jgi:hypothetical protein
MVATSSTRRSIQPMRASASLWRQRPQCTPLGTRRGRAERIPHHRLELADARRDLLEAAYVVEHMVGACRVSQCTLVGGVYSAFQQDQYYLFSLVG